MRLVLTGRNVDVTPALRQLIERKVTKLERLLNDSIVSTQVVLTQEKYRRVAEITVHARGDHVLRGMADAAAWPQSVNTALEKVAQQGHKLKDKWEKRKRRASGRKALAPSAPPEAPARPEPVAAKAAAGTSVVRSRRYPIKPMTVEDAAAKVERSADPFVVFRNPTTDALNIVYRRRDGRLGLIEPES